MEKQESEFEVDTTQQLIMSTPKPTIKRSTHYKFSIVNEITSNIEDYAPLLEILATADKTDKIELHINSGGGSCRTGYHIARLMHDCKAQIEVVVSYNCSSMAAIMAISGNGLLMAPGATLMFHNYSAGNIGKGAELIQSVQQQALQLSKLMEHYCAPFLTEAELDKINNDKDVYVHAWDRNLKARMKRHFKS